MRYIIGAMLALIVSVFIFLIFLRFAVQVHRSTLREARKNGYKTYQEFKRDAQKKEYIQIKKNRKRKKWSKYQKGANS